MKTNTIAIPRIVVAAAGSGSGKTTIVSGILAALRELGYAAQSYKIGPDYIDPGYHELASGRPGHNLDTWLAPEEKINELFVQTAKNCDIAVIEGVMGLYDGGKRGVSSTAAIAKQLAAPVALVIDAKSMGDSAAAVALGFRQYDEDVNFAGVILNRLGSASHRDMIVEAMENIGIPVLGCVFRSDAFSLPERHLGLTPVAENDARETIRAIGRAVAEQVNLNLLIETAKRAPAFPASPKRPQINGAPAVKIAVARDDAFSFYYPESLSVLEELGAELLPFSPLADAGLPEADGLIVGGGFPEMFAARLEANRSMRASIFEAGKNKMPIYAECGGLMYLSRRIDDFDGRSYEMVGLIPALCRMHEKLQTVGYIEAKALSDSLLFPKETVARGHEFHFSSMTVEESYANDFPWAFTFTKTRTGKTYRAGYASESILASYLHLHFAGNPDAARRFVAACRAYQLNKQTGAL